MIRTKGLVVGFVLLASANVAYSEETGLNNDVKVDFVENLNENAQLHSRRILSGWDALPGQHPHQISLRHVNRVGDVSGCGGVLIHRHWVLTAAHCIARGPVTTVVRAGLTDLETPEYISETNVAYLYPMYDWTRPLEAQPDDIGLVRLMQPVPYTKLARPIRIQSRADANRDYSGQIAYTSGFGRTWSDGTSPLVLQWVFLNVTSNEKCREFYGDLLTSSTICAGPFNVTSQSICHGDSGGPLVYIDDDGLPTLIGIASFVMGGEHGCHSGFPGAFVRPGAFHGWLREVTGLNFENLEEEGEEETATEEPITTTEFLTTEEDVDEVTTTTEEPIITTELLTTEEDVDKGITTTEEPATTTVIPTTTLDPEPESSKEIEESSQENSQETAEESSEEDSSEEDPELKHLLKHLEVQVNVKVKMNKFKKRHEVHVKHKRKNRLS